MSSDISSSPTCAERSAACCSSSPERQPLRRRITYVSMGGPSDRETVRSDPTPGRGAVQLALAPTGEVLRLALVEGVDLHAERCQLQRGDLLVDRLRHGVHAGLELARGGGQVLDS